MNHINHRISQLRQYMTEQAMDAIVIPTSDPHQSEYLRSNWQYRAFFSGFTGSAGTLVITQNEAALWTDSRYFLQVEQECCDTEVTLHKQSIPHAPEHVQWLAEILSYNAKVGLDYRLFSHSQFLQMNSAFMKKNVSFSNIEGELDQFWDKSRREIDYLISDHSTEFCGESRFSKFSRINDFLTQNKANYILLSKLDEIAWLFNIRAKEIDLSPFAPAYAIIGKKERLLFIDTSKLDAALRSKLEADGIQCLDYNFCTNYLQNLPKNTLLLIDDTSINLSIYSSILCPNIPTLSPIVEWKSIKNLTEIGRFKMAMKRDGVALVSFFHWLEDHLKNNAISEYELGQKLESFRQEQAHYCGRSFASIVGYNGNGAIIHYSAPKEGSALIKNEGIVLIDSGAQYEDGTTDITRTWWLGGLIPLEIKTCYTLVLKGYIELETAVFPVGTPGITLDALARKHLWEHGYSYGHGTGHGVGSFGLVHEPPQGFASTNTTSRGSWGHSPGQVSSIEPGCYIEEQFGIRIENLVLGIPKKTSSFGEYMGFESLSLCPIDTQLLDLDLLNSKEINWLNSYHKKVYENLKDELSPKLAEWLEEKCKTL